MGDICKEAAHSLGVPLSENYNVLTKISIHSMKMLFIWGLILALKMVQALDPDSKATCEPIKAEMCMSKTFMYNMTGMPNFASKNILELITISSITKHLLLFFFRKY